MSKNDGGPAFPSVKTDRQYTTDINVHSVGGMPLRDYFASKAMQGLCATTDRNPMTGSFLVKEAYLLADLMLAERTK